MNSQRCIEISAPSAPESFKARCPVTSSQIQNQKLHNNLQSHWQHKNIRETDIIDMPPPPDGENYTSDEDCIEGMFNQNGQCPECGGGGARYTLCQYCEDSGMIYEISPDRNSDRNNESESGDPIGHCQECNGVEQLASCAKTVKTLE